MKTKVYCRRSEAAAASRRRLVILGGVALVVIAVVAVVIAVSGSGGPSSPPGQNSSAAKAAQSRVDSLLAGIPQPGNNVLGSATAPVTITEYADLQCIACASFALPAGQQAPSGAQGSGIEDELISRYVRTGEVRLVYKSLETVSDQSPIPKAFQSQQSAAYAAGLQGKGWHYILMFYNEQGAEGTGYVTNAYLEGLARQIPGLDYGRWLADRASSTLASQVSSENAAGTALDGGQAATPTIVVKGPKGTAQPIVGLPASFSQLESKIKSVE